MKNLISQFLIAVALAFGSAYGLNAQSIQSTNPNSTTAGQSITMVITGTGTNFAAVTSFRLMSANGTVVNPISYTINSSTSATANFSIAPNAQLGNYRLQSFQYPDYFNALNVGVGPGSSYGWVAGRVVHDQTNDCIYTSGTDIPVNGAVVTLSPGGHTLTTSADGNYGGWIPLGSYTASYLLPGCRSWICPVAGTHPVSILTSLSSDVGNDFHFGNTPNCADLETSIWTSILRPGFTVGTWVTFRNNGPVTYTNAVGTFTLPPMLAIQSIYPAPTTVSGNTITWNIPSLAPNAQFGGSVQVTVPPNIGLGTTLQFTSSLPSSGIDYNLNNNNAIHYGDTQGSFDPNDKQVWDDQGYPADGPVDPNTATLKYLIRFQNTGTDTAFNIFVRDTLDALLDPATIHVIGSSHPYQFSMNGTGNVQFTFPNILLVDSFHNEPLSHGWIQYEIALDAGLPIGTVIPNNADIYFDFNAPVATNTTHTTLCPQVSAGFNTTQNTLLSWSFSNTSSGATSYLWNFGDGSTSTSASPNHLYFSQGTYVVCMTASNSCRSVTICDTIHACPVPTSGFNASVNGSTVVFTNTSTNGSTYHWDFGDGGTANTQGALHTYAASGTYLVCLTTTNTCTSVSFCDSVTICLAPNPSFTFSTAGLACSFTSNATGGVSYLWDFGDGNTSTATNPSHSYTSVGDYVVCLSVSSSCSTETVCDTVSVCVVPTAAFTSSVTGNTATFTDASNATTNSWAWDFGDGNTSAAQNPTHTYSGPGSYNVCLTTSNGCDTDSTCDPLTVLVGMQDPQAWQVKVSPNPSQGYFEVEVTAIEAGSMELRLYDLAGKLILEESMQLGTGSNHHTLDLSNHPAGTYLLKTTNPSGMMKAMRLVKE